MNDVKLLYIHFYIITLRVTSVFQYLDWSILKFTICIQRILRIPVAQKVKIPLDGIVYSIYKI